MSRFKPGDLVIKVRGGLADMHEGDKAIIISEKHKDGFYTVMLYCERFNKLNPEVYVQEKDLELDVLCTSPLWEALK